MAAFEGEQSESYADGDAMDEEIERTNTLDQGQVYDDGAPRTISLFEPSFDSRERNGSVFSAVFNLLSSMVGGGTLSLPYAFYKTGLVTGIIIMIIMALAADFSVYALISCSRKTGVNSLEEVTSEAFGHKMTAVITFIVGISCYLSLIGYAVLVRGIAGPIVDHYILSHDDLDANDEKMPSFTQNSIMVVFVMTVTPLMFLKSFSSLKIVGVISMMAIAILGVCIAIRSTLCNLNTDVNNIEISGNWKNILDSIPLFVCPFICHFNVLPIHKELENPSRGRIHSMVRYTIGCAAMFYIFVGVFGYFYGNCVDGIKGNILLNFEPDDELMIFARCSLTITILSAFPMLVPPTLESFVRLYYISISCCRSKNKIENQDVPLLSEISSDGDADVNDSKRNRECEGKTKQAFKLVIFWSALFLACFVESVTIIWGVVGSCFAICLGFIFPCGSYLVIKSKRAQPLTDLVSDRNRDKKIYWSRCAAWTVLTLFIPLALMCTVNSVYNLFWKN
mmetsp:Transcript_48428/g.94654  ORF Transcript_48428/g.94654 Transcript_48428/m.94654 type:complete len:508 (+) Transcript_48428:262-1785(+)